MLTYEMSVEAGGMIHWIQSVYVVPEARQKGVFRALYEHVCGQAFKENQCGVEVKCVRLYCEKDNERAKQVYTRVGMNRQDQLEFFDADFVFSLSDETGPL